MSYYYRQKFTSPSPIYALVKEEFRSYFDSGAVDDTLFPIWTNQCLARLGKAAYEIIPSIVHIKNYKGVLPDDFISVREAWICSQVQKDYRIPSAIYNQIIETSTRVDNQDVRCNVCNECQNPPVIQAIYKTTGTILMEYTLQELLKPGIINNITCPQDLYCANFNSVSPYTYDVKDNKFLVTFKEGTVYLNYYSEQFDNQENLLIPDQFYTKMYIEKYLKQKTMEQLFNQTTDETFNQIKYKLDMYKQEASEFYILADTENKKETIDRKVRAIKRTQNRFKSIDRLTNRRY